MKNYDIIIIGGGAMGLATAAELANTNKQTLVIEQFSFFNQKGSSAGLSRQFRVQYAQKYMAELALESISYWEKLQKTTSDILIDKVGSLWFGDPRLNTQEGGIKASMNVMDELGIPYTELTASEIEAQFPFKNIPIDYHGFFQQNGGIIDFSATQKALYKISDKAKNVDLIDETLVINIESLKNGAIIVTTDKETFTTQKLVITPGAYINDILRFFNLSVDIDIWEMSSAYYKKTSNIKLPTWFVFQKPQNTSLFYGFPEVDWAHPGYFRVAPDIADKTLQNPTERTKIPSSKSLKLNEDWVKNHMVGLDDTSKFTSTCLITLSKNDEELLLDTLPESINNHKNIIVYTGGWAAKFTPLLGKILSDLVVTGKTAYDISNFNINYNPIE